MFLERRVICLDHSTTEEKQPFCFYRGKPPNSQKGEQRVALFVS
uniref:Uncharacterized protein n=1 Tax=Arundo donax TaxID=35708 RepID=A0A0A9A9N2_ARUDO